LRQRGRVVQMPDTKAVAVKDLALDLGGKIKGCGNREKAV